MFRKLRYYSLLLIGLALIFSGSGCKKSESSTDSHNEVPVVAVNIVLNPNSTEYINLNIVGGWETLTGGYRGIIVYRKSQDEFTAFDRACPYDWSVDKARLVVDASGLTASCPNCKSKYILLDGTPYEGPSHYSLKQYQTQYDGNLLYIFN
jgi:nitrite reductase/ring-hydroxylating ferredoxin subunit